MPIRSSSRLACAKRVGLARALAVDARVVLLDEPFSAVDEQTRRKFQEDLLELVGRERKTFIFVTHSIEEAVYLSDRIVLLSNARAASPTSSSPGSRATAARRRSAATRPISTRSRRSGRA